MARSKIDYIAYCSLGLAAVSSAFAIYQWWSSDRDERIRAAVELSNKYIGLSYQDPFRSLKMLEEGNATLQKENPGGQLALIEYAAYLANRQRADTNYLAQYLKCDIVRLADAKTGPGSVLKGFITTEAKKFANNQRSTCDSK